VISQFMNTFNDGLSHRDYVDDYIDSFFKCT